MLWMAVLGAILVWSALPRADSVKRNSIQISPKPCWVDGMEGTCMFVYECIKSEGFHIGMCVDTFMFGSCCAHNISENTVLQHSNPQVLYSSPSHNFSQQVVTKKPAGGSHKVTSRPSLTHSTKVHTNYPAQSQQLTVSMGVKPSMSRFPTSPPRHSTPPPRHSVPMSTDSLEMASSINIGIYTKPGWQVSTEPTFITSSNKDSHGHHHMNAIYVGGVAHKDTTNSPGKIKMKPVHMNKYKPTKKPIQNSTKHKPLKTPNSTKRPALISPSVFIENNSISSFEMNKSMISPDLMPTSTISNLLYSDLLNKNECGVPKMISHPQTRIVGGKSAPFGKWPWQVSVRRTSFFGFSSTHRCGGAVLNENWIATAAHCVDDLLTSQIRIRVGEYDFSNAQEELPYIERAVAKKIVHPKYNYYSYEYDLALVKLDKPLEFLPHIAPICLPASDDILIGEMATVTGWGRLSQGGTLPSVLQEVQVPIVSNDKCKTMFHHAGRHEYIPDIFICAGREVGGHDSCQGDSGGPLQVKGKDGRYFLAGIISWGIGCAEANLPGVCTRISKFVPWILKNVT